MRTQPRELCAADLVYPLGSGAAAETAAPLPLEVAMERVNDASALIGEAQGQALGRDPAQVAAEVCKCCNCGKLARPRNSLWLCSGCRTVMCALSPAASLAALGILVRANQRHPRALPWQTVRAA